MRLRVAVTLTVLCVVFARAGMARADEQSDLDKGRAAYFAKNYDDAEQRFRAMLDDKTGTLHDPLLVAEARMYLGATLFAEGRSADAKKVFDQLILDNPAYEPDPSRLPQDVVNVFIDEKASLRETLRQQREKELAEKRAREQAEREEKAQRARYQAALEAQASDVPVVKQHSRLVAMLPFGIGQFQNGDKALGWTFAITESLFAAAATVAVPIYLVEVGNAADEYSTFGESHRTQFEALRNRANGWRDVDLVSIGAFALTYVVGVAQAQAAFVPQTTVTEHRALPKVSVAPAAGEAPRGAWVGIRGSF